MVFEIQKVIMKNYYRYDNEGNLTNKHLVFYQLKSEGLKPIRFRPSDKDDYNAIDFIATVIYDESVPREPQKLHIDFEKKDKK